MADYDRPQLRAELSRDEARRNRVYRDSVRTPAHPIGILTVGVGWNLEANGIPESVLPLLDMSQGDPHDPAFVWSEAAMDALLDIGIDRAEHGLDGLLPGWRELDPVRQRVCLNLCFNMGAHVLGEFKHTLAAIAAGDWDAAATGMESSAWYRQVGDRGKRLVSMMETGTAPEIVA